MTEPSAPETKQPLPWVLSAAATAVMTLVLFSQGRLWWCKSGDWSVYVGEAWNSSHTSQHIFDPYTFTHILHGVMFSWIAAVLFGRLSVDWRFFIAVIAEVIWEIIENSAWIIEKYRANTASLDYFGDSIANSIGDVIACAVGFIIASSLKKWWSLVFFLAVELFLLLWIRDSLLVNIIMLTFPLDAIKDWQMRQF